MLIDHRQKTNKQPNKHTKKQTKKQNIEDRGTGDRQMNTCYKAEKLPRVL